MADVVDAELLYADDAHAIGSLGIVFINIIRKPTSMVMLKETRRQVQRHFRRVNNRSAALSVIEPSAAQSVAKDVRDESAALTVDFPALAAAMVIEGSGFRAAATRTAMVGLFLISRPKYPNKVFGSVADAGNWLLATVPDLGVSADALVRAVEITRRAFK